MVNGIGFGSNWEKVNFETVAIHQLQNENNIDLKMNTGRNGEAVPAAKMTAYGTDYNQKESHPVRNTLLTLLGAAGLAGLVYLGAKKGQTINVKPDQTVRKHVKDWSKKIVEFADDITNKVKNVFTKTDKKTNKKT